jgi:hypothetical protein
MNGVNMEISTKEHYEKFGLDKKIFLEICVYLESQIKLSFIDEQNFYEAIANLIKKIDSDEKYKSFCAVYTILNFADNIERLLNPDNIKKASEIIDTILKDLKSKEKFELLNDNSEKNKVN